MKLSDVMHRNVEVIKADSSVREAARLMSKLDVGALPVRGTDGIVGMVTDRDLVVRAIARGDDPDKTRVIDAMTRDPECCYEDDEIETASQKMSERQIQRLLVLDHEEKLVGIVALADLARAGVAHRLEEIKAPTKPSAIGTSTRSAAH